MIESIDDLKKQYDEKILESYKIKEKIDEKLKETLVACRNNKYGDGCGMTSIIRELTYIQTLWYEEPHGCFGGDVWHHGEGQWICPHCKHRNRLFDKPDISKLKYMFKNIMEE